MLQAKENKQLDWETIDRLMENPDFKSFINDFEEDVKIKKIKSKYDDYFEDDESAEEYSRKKKYFINNIPICFKRKGLANLP